MPTTNMYHDRRPTSQSPSSRNHSPLPRRPISNSLLPHRPGLFPRSSTYSGGSSTANLAATLRSTNGSALKNELRTEPSYDVRDPLQVLEVILDSEARDSKQSISISGGPAPNLNDLDDIDFQNLSLDEFVLDVEPKNSNERRKFSEMQPAEYDKEKGRFEELHKSITACDQVLKSVETFLTGFQADLGAVSSEIESLQSRSTSMNSKLENRRVVEKLLGPSVEELSLSPDLVRKISDGNIDEGWIRAIADLDKRSKAIHAKSHEQRKIKALDDLLPILESLQNRAVERIRDYLVAQIKALRSPNINAQLIQQQGLLNFKDIYTFLASHQPQLGDQIRQAYINTMKWYYLSHFTRYEAALRQIKLHPIDKNDLIGSADDPSVKRPRGVVVTHDAFSIGRRLDVMKNPSGAALSSYVAEEDKTSHYLEAIFRSFNMAIVDNASFEYTFLSSFFSPSYSFHAITRTFESIFSTTFKLGQDLTKSLVDNSTDALGILICVRLNQHFAFEFQRRKVPPGEAYINGTSMSLWPRFQMIMDLHCESLRKLTLSVQSPAPHPLTQRFASFLHGVLALSSETGDDEPVSRSLARLRKDYEALIMKMSKTIGEVRKRDRFVSNNYSFVGTILEDAPGRLADENKKHFQELKKKFGGDAA